MGSKEITLERIDPEITKPGNLLKIWRGKTDMYPLSPLGVMFIWHEHVNRYEFASRLADGIVLDAACGTGYGFKILKSGNKQISYIGMDVDNSALQQTSERTKKSPLLKIDLNDTLPFPDNSIGTFISFETIEHLKNPNSLVCESRRILKPGGHLILSTPNSDVFSKNGGSTNQYHEKEFNPEEFNQLITKHFPNAKFYYQGGLSSDDLGNHSSARARLNRLLGMINGKQTQVVSDINSTPRYLIAVGKKE